MSAEVDVRLSQVRVDDLIAALRAYAATHAMTVAVHEARFHGLALPIWGKRLDPGDDDAWDEAQMEADMHEGTIETLRTAGGDRFDAMVYYGPYREQVLEALYRTGGAAFVLDTFFVTIAVTWDAAAPPLLLHLDRTTAATGGTVSFQPHEAAWLLHQCDSYSIADDSGIPIRHFIQATELLDIVAQYATLRLFDTTGYVDSRDEAHLMAAYAMNRQLHHEWRALLLKVHSFDDG